MSETKSLKDLVKLLADAAVLISDGIQGFSFSQVTHLIALISELNPVLGELPSIVTQYRALDDAGRQDLYGFIVQNVTFPADVKVELVIEKLLEVAVSISAVVKVLA